MKSVWAFIKDEDNMKQTAFSKGRQYLFTLGSHGPVSITVVLKRFTKIQHFFSTMTYLAVSPGYFRLLLELYHSINDADLYTFTNRFKKKSFSEVNLELKSRWQCQYFHLVYTGECWLECPSSTFHFIVKELHGLFLTTDNIFCFNSLAAIHWQSSVCFAV